MYHTSSTKLLIQLWIVSFWLLPSIGRWRTSTSLSEKRVSVRIVPSFLPAVPCLQLCLQVEWKRSKQDRSASKMSNPSHLNTFYIFSTLGCSNHRRWTERSSKLRTSIKSRLLWSFADLLLKRIQRTWAKSSRLFFHVEIPFGFHTNFFFFNGRNRK